MATIMVIIMPIKKRIQTGVPASPAGRKTEQNASTNWFACITLRQPIRPAEANITASGR